ncbi:hypothetical protein DUI87_13861 [Hirundo rustica rustica]|uniref:ribonuclease H n=1 Tax=Hirundo rustica rustica TaxID=333673 RepID=A0A3M0KNY2_HIRRU|nr:hypothetical protein DUI87_13861 [Hirundo rustica rustica]
MTMMTCPTPLKEPLRHMFKERGITRLRGALPLASPIWPVRKSEGEWRLTVDYRALNEVTPPLSTAVPDMLELQYELESKAAKCPTICHRLIQTALKKSEAPEHLQYIDDIIVWWNTAAEVFEKGKEIIQILLEAGFTIKKSKVKGPAHEIQFLGVKWQDGWRQIPTDVINKITVMSPPTNKKETQAFLGAIGFWRMHIPGYSQIVSPLYLVTHKKNDFHWGPEQQQAFAQFKQEIAHAVALGPVRMGPEVKNVLYSAARSHGLSWSLWQKVPGMNRKWKAAVWSPTRQLAEATEGEGGSSQLAELKAVQLALDIAEREGWPRLYLYTDSWMVANALWGWLKRWKEANWQRGGKPIWAAEEWKNIATRIGRLPVKVRHVDAHFPKSRANEEHRNNEQVDWAAKIEVSKIDLDWEHKGELFLARWAHDASGHQGRDATYKWARDRGMDLTMDSISQVIHDCETCATIKQAKRVKPLWYGGQWSKYKYGEAWQIDYITLPQTRQGKRYVLTVVEATTGLETYPVPHATARNTILGLEKQILWRHGTPERIESDNGTHFKNSLINTWAREHGIEWVYHIPYHAPAAGKVERHKAQLSKTQLKALGGGSFKNWEQHLAKATWLVNTRGSTN